MQVCTQGVQQSVGASRDTAVFIGSGCSGYATGFFAAPAEWAKVQRGTSTSTGTSSMRTILRASLTSPHGRTRLHFAGCRNALFDATFFASEHAARSKAGAPPALSYGCAAALAVVIDYPLDAAVKRAMAVPPSGTLSERKMLSATWALLRERRAGIFTGLLAKVCEFAISYAVTGYCSSHVVRWLS